MLRKLTTLETDTSEMKILTKKKKISSHFDKLGFQ